MDPTSPVNRVKGTCENITFSRTSYVIGKERKMAMWLEPLFESDLKLHTVFTMFADLLLSGVGSLYRNVFGET